MSTCKNLIYLSKKSQNTVDEYCKSYSKLYLIYQ